MLIIATYKALIHTLFNHILHDDVPVTGSPLIQWTRRPGCNRQRCESGRLGWRRGRWGHQCQRLEGTCWWVDGSIERRSYPFLMFLACSLRCHQTWEHPPVWCFSHSNLHRVRGFPQSCKEVQSCRRPASSCRCSTSTGIASLPGRPSGGEEQMLHGGYSWCWVLWVHHGE